MANVTMIPARIRKKGAESTEKPKKNVAAYCRVSTDSDEQAGSYDTQVEHYTSYINGNPEWNLAGIYADDGISGTNTKKREEFNRMIRDCMDGKIELIITKSISRFARNTLDCLQYIRMLKDKGVAVFFEKENINTLDAKGELLLTIMASLAQQESQSLSQNVKMGIQFRYQAGKVQVNHNRFLGYTKDDDGNLVIVPEEAAVIKRIYREYLEGRSLPDICNNLMADGILTGAGKQKWYPSTVQKILTNEKYIGDALLQKTVTIDFLEKKRASNIGIAPQYYVEGDHEAIIPKDIYMRVQEEMTRRSVLHFENKKRTYSSKYALSCLCTCGKCGDVYRRVVWNNRGKRSAVWRCSTRVYEGPEACDAPTIPEEDIQRMLMDAINKVWRKRSNVIKELKKMTKDVLSISREGELKELETQLREKEKELMDRALKRIDYEELADEVDALKEERQRIFMAQSLDKGKQMRQEELIRFLEGQKNKVGEYDEQMIRRLIEKVTIHEKGNLTVEFKSGTIMEVR